MIYYLINNRNNKSLVDNVGGADCMLPKNRSCNEKTGLHCNNGEMRGVPARWGDPAEGGRARVPAQEGVPACGFVDLWAVWAWEYHEPGPPNDR